MNARIEKYLVFARRQVVDDGLTRYEEVLVLRDTLEHVAKYHNDDARAYRIEMEAMPVPYQDLARVRASLKLKEDRERQDRETQREQEQLLKLLKKHGIPASFNAGAFRTNEDQ